LLAHFMSGVAAAGSVYGLLFGLFLARWWQAALYNPGGFRADYPIEHIICLATILLL